MTWFVLNARGPNAIQELESFLNNDLGQWYLT